MLRGALDEVAEVVYIPGAEISNEMLRDAQALITRTRTKCNEKLLKNTSVKLIATATIGYDHIDTHYCDANGIKWTNAPGCNSSSVQQYIASALLHLAEKKQFNLSEKTIGIVGVGNVGSKVAKLCETLGMKVLLNDPPRARQEGDQGFVSLDQLCEQADIITFHVPLTRDGIDKTYHLLDDTLISQMKQDVIIINSSRGEVVNGVALKKAITSAKTGGVVLDVWENEPSIDLELLEMVDYGTPHIAGYSSDGKANGSAMSVQAISRYFNLGLDNWYPANVPQPASNQIEIDTDGKTVQQILLEAVGATYSIANDDATLRNSPDTFEKQRGDYPVRREFPAYNIILKQNNGYVKNILDRLGFSVMSPA